MKALNVPPLNSNVNEISLVKVLPGKKSSKIILRPKHLQCIYIVKDICVTDISANERGNRFFFFVLATVLSSLVFALLYHIWNRVFTGIITHRSDNSINQ